MHHSAWVSMATHDLSHLLLFNTKRTGSGNTSEAGCRTAMKPNMIYLVKSLYLNLKLYKDIAQASMQYFWLRWLTILHFRSDTRWLQKIPICPATCFWLSINVNYCMCSGHESFMVSWWVAPPATSKSVSTLSPLGKFLLV